MKDIQTHLDKIRSDAAECLLLSTLVADGKREVFAKTAEHLNALALEVEKTIATNGAEDGARGESEHMARPGDSGEAVATDIAVAHHKQARSRQVLPWLLVVILGGIVGALSWANNPAKIHWSLITSQSKHEMPPTPQDETKQAIASLLAGEQAERKILMEQLSWLGSRLDNLARAVDNLKIAHAENAALPNQDSVGADEKPPTVETTPSSSEEKPSRKDESRTSTLESPAAAGQPNTGPRATDSPLVEPPDRVGAIPAPARRAELDQRKPTIGPAGCTQFRSFDPVSGTYTTLDGRRRQCR
jgi:BA14K-like protein